MDASRANFVVVPPKNGACLVPKSRALDVRFIAALSDGVQTAARQQEAAGDEVDDVELHASAGPFGWRAYVHQELRAMRARSGGVA